MDSTTLLPVIHENSLNPIAELKQPDTYRRVFTYHLPDKHCFFIKAGSTGDMKPAIQPHGLVLIKPLDIELPVKHQLINKQHPRLLNHLELVALIHNNELLLRRTYASVNTKHQSLNAYMFAHYPQNFEQDEHPIVPESDNPVKIVGKVIEVINYY